MPLDDCRVGVRAELRHLRTHHDRGRSWWRHHPRLRSRARALALRQGLCASTPATSTATSTISSTTVSITAISIATATIAIAATTKSEPAAPIAAVSTIAAVAAIATALTAPIAPASISPASVGPVPVAPPATALSASALVPSGRDGHRKCQRRLRRCLRRPGQRLRSRLERWHELGRGGHRRRYLLPNVPERADKRPFHQRLDRLNRARHWLWVPSPLLLRLHGHRKLGFDRG